MAAKEPPSVRIERLLAAGDHVGAFAAAEELLRVAPSSAIGRFGRARALLRMGNQVEAARDLDMALAASPKDEHVRLVKAKLESRFYDDLDIMPVMGASVAVEQPLWTTARLVRYAMYAVLGFAIAVWWHRRKRAPAAAATPAWAPSRITPLGVVTGLRRLEQDLPADKAKALRDEIVLLELKYFGPNAADSSESELRSVVEKWQRA